MIGYFFGLVGILFVVYLIFYFYTDTATLSDYTDASTLVTIPATSLADWEERIANSRCQ